MVNASLADLRTGSLVELIGSNEIAPGAGAAGAVALALGAACAAKAAAVSLRHSLDDTRPSLALTHLRKLRDCALQGADTDARTFADYIRHRTAEGARS
jgi:formiminotetrahydrofolate cyclodeaminase